MGKSASRVFVVAMMLVNVAHAQDVASGAPDPEAGAAALAERLDDLSGGVRQLRADVGQTYRRLAAIELSMRDRLDGARVTITQRNEAGPFYRLIEVSYAIDGQSVYHQRDESGALGRSASIDIHDGTLSPGEHHVSIVLRYVGDGGEVLRYLEGYRFVVRSGTALFAPPGQRVRLNVRAIHHGFDVPYEQRLGIVRERSLEPLD